MIAANFRRHPAALALQLPLPFGTVLRWATRKPTTVLMRAIRAARGVAFAAAGRIKRPEPRQVPGWAREAARRAKALAKAQAQQQREWFTLTAEWFTKPGSAVTFKRDDFSY